MERTVRGWSILYMVFGVAGAIMGLVQLVDETGGAVAMNQLGETWIRSGGDFGTVVYLLLVVVLAAVRIALGVMGLKLASLDKVWKPVLVLSIVHIVLSVVSLNIGAIIVAAVGLFIYVMYYNMDYKAFYGL